MKLKPSDEILDAARYFCQCYSSMKGNEWNTIDREIRLTAVAIFLTGITKNMVFDVEDGELRGKVVK